MGSLGLTWVVEIYSLLFAALLFTSASVGDRYGRKKLMQIGLALFVASSLYAGLLASSGIELIVARAVMGIGAALVMPTTLSVINVVFPPQERARAISIWTAVAGIGMMLGFVVGGLLLDKMGWQSPFLVSGAVAAVTVIANQFLVNESRDERQTPVDWLGGALSTVGLFALVYGIMEAPTRGMSDWWVIAALATAVVYAHRVRAGAAPDHPSHARPAAVQEQGVRSVGVRDHPGLFCTLAGVLFAVSQLFMLVLGYSAFKTALAIVPIMLPMLFLSPLAPVVSARIGSRWTVSLGLLLVVVGFSISSRWPTVPTLGQVYLGMMIVSGGVAFAMTPSTSLLMSAVPRSRSGMGSAMNDTTRELGGALGIAVLGALLSSGYADKMAAQLGAAPEQLRTIAEKSLAGALAIAPNLGSLSDAFSHMAREAWMQSLMFSMLIGGFIVSAAAMIASLWMPHRERWVAPQPAEEPAPAHQFHETPARKPGDAAASTLIEVDPPPVY